MKTLNNDISYNIISTGSKGNAVIINNFILIDCGVSFKSILPYIKSLKLVLLTHIHTDHFNKTTVRLLASERPTLRFLCGDWMVKSLIDCEVDKSNIDIVKSNNIYDYGLCSISPVELVHDVNNYGYKIHFCNKKMFYATDTNSLDGIKAINYELYMIEANYEDEEIKERIKRKKENGEYAYEYKVIKNHLSKAKCDDFIYKNAGALSEYVYLHCHYDEK